ncbi:MAG: hypothetical protein KDI63_11125 [Gammaproteobacteria bacterium]|nr:hypothetical protein [Gammaproteobacteria bacterium]
MKLTTNYSAKLAEAALGNRVGERYPFAGLLLLELSNKVVYSLQGLLQSYLRASKCQRSHSLLNIDGSRA